MSYVVQTPNAAQSPGLFPTQANNNFQRLKDIINSDHNFLDSFAVDQGWHKQVHLLPRATPTDPVGSSIIYTQPDASSVMQLWYWNGGAAYKITPSVFVVSGQVTMDNLNFTTVFQPPDYVTGEISFRFNAELTNTGGMGTFSKRGPASQTAGYSCQTFNSTVNQKDFYPIILATNGYSDLAAKTSNAAYNGTYNWTATYRLYTP